MFPFIFAVILIAPMNDGFQIEYYFKSILAAISLLIIFSLLIAILDVKILKVHYLKLNKRISKLFQSDIQSENLNMVKIGKYDVYILINSEGNYPIEFHIPRNQIDKMKHKPDFNLEKFTVDRMETYKIGESSSLMLKRNKRRVEKKIEAVTKYK